MKEFEAKAQFIIEPTRKEEIPVVLELIKSAPDALLDVSEKEVENWIESGHSIVAKTADGKVIGHQGAVKWKESGWVEVRAALVKPEHRGKGTNTDMKKRIIKKIRSDNPDATISAFTEKASKSRGILQKLGFQEISLEQTPEEFFSICPDICVKKTGVDCGCKVYVLTPEREIKDE